MQQTIRFSLGIGFNKWPRNLAHVRLLSRVMFQEDVSATCLAAYVCNSTICPCLHGSLTWKNGTFWSNMRSPWLTWTQVEASRKPYIQMAQRTVSRLLLMVMVALAQFFFFFPYRWVWGMWQCELSPGHEPVELSVLQKMEVDCEQDCRQKTDLML